MILENSGGIMLQLHHPQQGKMAISFDYIVKFRKDITYFRFGF